MSSLLQYLAYWERHACSLSTSTQPNGNGPWAWNTSLSRDKLDTGCVNYITMCGNIFPCFRCNEHSFVSTESVCHMAPDQAHCYVCLLKRVEEFSFRWSTREMHTSELSCIWSPGGTHWPQGTDAHHWSLFCCLFSK